MTDKITCKICDAEVHAIQLHLKKDHPELNMTVDDTRQNFLENH